MPTEVFDALKYMETLEAAGIPEAHAKAIARGARDAQNLAELATKADVRELELRLRAELTLMKWMLGIIVAGIASLVAKSFF